MRRGRQPSGGEPHRQSLAALDPSPGHGRVVGHRRRVRAAPGGPRSRPDHRGPARRSPRGVAHGDPREARRDRRRSCGRPGDAGRQAGDDVAPAQAIAMDPRQQRRVRDPGSTREPRLRPRALRGGGERPHRPAAHRRSPARADRRRNRRDHQPRQHVLVPADPLHGDVRGNEGVRPPFHRGGGRGGSRFRCEGHGAVPRACAYRVRTRSPGPRTTRASLPR